MLEAPGNGFVRRSFRQQPQHLQFSRGEPDRRRLILRVASRAPRARGIDEMIAKFRRQRGKALRRGSDGDAKSIAVDAPDSTAEAPRCSASIRPAASVSMSTGTWRKL